MSMSVTANTEPDGVLVLDKPAGITSHDAVMRVRRLFGTRKVGHAGTLDPMATGVLIVLIGRAAKAAEYITADEKFYEARMRLGVETDTLDTTGQLLRECAELPDATAVVGACATFVGKQGQVPPMYSAIKKNGVKMVDLARRGVELELEPREIEIFSLDCRPTGDPREYSLSVHCSKGTYIRALCRDIGSALHCGAAMSALRRTRSGSFDISDAHTLEQIEELSDDGRRALLCPAESLFGALPGLDLPEFFAHLAHSGALIYQAKLRTSFAAGERVRLCDADGFFALGEALDTPDGSAVKPIKQFRL